MEMRRKDLAVTEKEQIDAIIQSCDCCLLYTSVSCYARAL